VSVKDHGSSSESRRSTSKLGRRELVTYAFLSHGIYGSDDRLAGLLPLFQPVVEPLAGELFDPKDLVDRVNAAYPWSINTDIAENLIPRFQAAGWLESVVSYHGDTAFRYTAPTSPAVPDVAYNATERELREIGVSFEAFIQALSPLTSAAYTAEQLEELLLGGSLKSAHLTERAFLRQ
jgi:hypothetical protein